MKKTIITMLIALVAIFASAETYSYLKFTKTNGTTLTYSSQGLKLTYDNANVYVSNAETSATIALAEVQDMYFSNDPGTASTIGDVNGDGLVNITDVTMLISALMNDDFSSIITDNADLNNDQAINITDVTMLINMVMSATD